MQNTPDNPRPDPKKGATITQPDQADAPTETDDQSAESESSSDEVAQTGTDLDFRPAA